MTEATPGVRRMKTADAYMDLIGSRWLIRTGQGQVLASVDADCWQEKRDAVTVAQLLLKAFMEMGELEL